MNYESQFRAAARRLEGGRFRRILYAPVRLPYSKAIEILASKTKTPIHKTARTFWGGPMHVVFPERVSTTIYRYGFFEAELTQVVLSLLKPGMTFFDVGAHFGFFSLLASELVGNSGQVHSFEPTPSTFEVLRDNIATRPNSRATNAALWNEEGTLQFTDYGIAYSAFNSIQNNDVHDNLPRGVRVREHSVRALTLDAYVDQTGHRPDFIKMDAEGAEIKILEGMTRTLRSHKPIISFEVGDAPNEPLSKSRDLVDRLLGEGYDVFQWTAGGLVKHQPQTRYGYDNLIAMARI